MPHSGLSDSGAMDSIAGDRKNAIRSGVPNDWIAPTCRLTAKMAPIKAATICAIRRVRLGPIARNMATTATIASDTAMVARARTAK